MQYNGVRINHSSKVAMKKYFWDYVKLLSVAGAVIALDQWTKALLRARLELGETWVPSNWIGAFIQIVRTQNTGAAFSLGRGLGPLFAALAIAAAAAFLYFYPRILNSDLIPHAPNPARTRWIMPLALGLLLGGALGNLLDRLLQGQVTDFIWLRYFAIINVADIGITCGAAILILWVLILEHQAKKPAAPPVD
jgi:signal peptidase II